MSAYRKRQRRELTLLRAAFLATPESFEDILNDAFPPFVTVAVPCGYVEEQWWVSEP